MPKDRRESVKVSSRRDREREREKKRRSRSRSKSPHSRRKRRSRSPRDRRRSRSPKESSRKKDKSDDGGEKSVIAKALSDTQFAEQKLELEMQKRRERIESWRQKRKNQEEEKEKDEIIKQAEEAAENAKKWSLEEEDEEEEENGKKEAEAVKEEPMETEPKKEEKKEEEDEVDPLDAFMQNVNNEVRQLNKSKGHKSSTDPNDKKVVVVITKVAHTKDGKKKGDIIEQDADALEYSDEGESNDVDGQISLATKAKQLAITDHSKVYYRPFRKNFYVEIPEISRMTEEEVARFRLELEEIKIRGKNCPRPVKTWAQCGCSRAILDVLKKHNYEKPTPIQAQAIPAVMSGRDVIGIAKTGSGKTLAFLLPMLRHIMDQEPLEDMDGPIAVIMSPTRELAMQTHKECKRFARILGLTSVCVYGGAGISEQIAELKKGAEIVVCTPGRMIDMLAANNGRVTNLRRVTFLVLDEADRMFDMGFEPQVMRILGNIRPDRQTVLFSATFPPKMEGLARKILQKPVEILVGSKSVVCKDIEQHVVILEEYQKFLKLLELLGIYWELGSCLVFVEKQEKADELVGDLMKNGYNCAPLHGGIDQFDRDSTILDFKAGRIKLLIATSVAARGLDVKKLILVVNYDCPNHYEDYVHRVGRTGRAGNKGFAYTFILPATQERYAGDIYLALERSGATIPEDLAQLWNDFKAKMKEEGKDIKQGGGFGGHGFRFDEAEAEAVSSKKKMEKLVKGLEDDNEDEDEIDNQITSLMKSTKRVTDASSAPKFVKDKIGVVKEDLLEKAKQAAKQIQIDKQFGVGAKDATQQTAEAVMKGSTIGPVSVSAKTVAGQIAEKLHERLNYIPSETIKEEEIQETKYYEEELEINDFPQQVRWRVCSRETLSLIQEYSEVGISVRGSFVPSGKQPPEGDRRLYLSIESTSEIALSRAKAEIVRVLREELKRLSSQGQQGGPKGRYKVL